MAQLGPGAARVGQLQLGQVPRASRWPSSAPVARVGQLQLDPGGARVEVAQLGPGAARGGQLRLGPVARAANGASPARC
ncbi:MAG: hypothetical protein ACJ8AT_30860 [Hyalangium sp.]|uniref:hypothetical protein n=1 Tax=Hyalangium sp. TaxID=2028555 RepID=UPI0038997FA2